mgnify:CR=1 FL=1
MTRQLFDCAVPAERARGLADAAAALGDGLLVVVPTDTVYGISADAFNAGAVADLLASKGRGRAAPPPVLIGALEALDGLATDISDHARTLAEAFWPGGLTLVCRSQPTLSWDLGDTSGTVALRMPLHPVALELLAVTGPLATSSANITGSPAALGVAEAVDQLGDSVAIYLDGGPCLDQAASTIVETTGPVLRVLRDGAVGRADLFAVIGEDAWEREAVAAEPGP